MAARLHDEAPIGEQTGDIVAGRYRVRARLEGGSGGGGRLVASDGRGRKGRWVLARLPGVREAPSLRERLRTDFPRLCSLRHELILPPERVVVDAARGCRYLARRYVEGLDLATAARGRPLDDVLAWLATAAAALGALHRSGLVHGAVSGTNVLIPRRGLFRGRRRQRPVVLCDPAWWLPDETPLAVDLHALGKLFYALLSGAEPEASTGGFPAPVTDLRPEVPVDIERVVMRLVHPDPARRYADTDALLRDLERSMRRRSWPRAPRAECPAAREPELTEAIGHLLDGDRPVVLAVRGEGRSGKSTLLSRLRLEAEIRDFRTAWTRCYRRPAPLLAPLRELFEQTVPAGASGRGLRRRARDLFDETEGEPDESIGVLDEESTQAEESLLSRATELLSGTASSPPTVLFLEDSHLAAPLTISCLARWVREIVLAAQSGSHGPRRGPRLVISMRSERPLLAALRPLLDALDASPDVARTLELSPLQGAVVAGWAESALGMPPPTPPADSTPEPDIGAIYAAFVDALEPASRALLEVLALLGRPASSELAATVSGLAIPSAHRAIRALLGGGVLCDAGDGVYFEHESLAAWIAERLPADTRRTWHRRIAEALTERGEVGPEEVARHWLGADSARPGWKTMLRAARAHMRHHDAAEARRLYRAVLDVLPSSRAPLRAGIVEELAEASMRLGDHREATRRLGSLLDECSEPAARGQLLARVGHYLHRAGEDDDAVARFEEALDLLSAEEDAPEEVRVASLRIESERAEIAGNRGDHRGAESICRRALGRNRRYRPASRTEAITREEMVLTETLAHVRLREYRYDEARELFGESLAIARRLGAALEESQILNNLGILHIQEHRFAEAIDCYRRSGEVARERRDDQTLSAVCCNLAILHAKVGELEEADGAREEAARSAVRCGSRRTRLLYLHTAGLVDLAAGRYLSATESFRESVRLASELDDPARQAFDLVYLGECSIFRNEPKAAFVALERAREGSPPPPLPRMVAARTALLHALRGDGKAARESLRELDALAESSLAPGVDAWNRLYAGWARRRIGDLESASSDLEAAGEFFRGQGIQGGEIHAELERAALHLDGGRPKLAEARFRRLESRYRCGEGPLGHPLLSARWLIYRAWIDVEVGSGDPSAAMSNLVEAESYLVGRRSPDLEALAIRLRQRLHLAGFDTASPAPGRRAGSIAARSSEEVGALRALRDAAEAVVARMETHLPADHTRELRSLLDDYSARLDELRRGQEASCVVPGDVVTAECIVGRSPAIRALAASIRRLAVTDVPVLITGETGVGKELVARALHGESRRAGRPFVSVSSAALPAELIEAELFGYQQGAFTGAETSRRGLLVGADGGSLLLDEVADLPLDVQSKILRILDRPAVRPLGDVEEVPVDVRFLFSTNREIGPGGDETVLRRDLYYRLSAFELRVPPLRERPEDLPHLVEHFGREAAVDGPPVVFERDALAELAAYPWPGNVRELRNVVLRLVLTGKGRVSASDVRHSLDSRGAVSLFSPALLRSRPLPELVARLEEEYLRLLGVECAGDTVEMARRLGIRRRALYDRLKRAGIRPKDLRRPPKRP